MQEPVLTQRLSTIANYIPVGARLADIGTDHAYLPVYLALEGKISSAVASDINEGPVAAARAHVERYQLQSIVDVRQGDGFDVLNPGEVDVAVIAGMGGALISQLLEKGADKLATVNRLIIQPNLSGHLVRKWLLEHHWQLMAEQIIEEKGKWYEVLMAEAGDGEAPYADLNDEERDQAIYMGPFLLREKNEAFVAKWTHERQLKYDILSSLSQSISEESKDRMKQIKREISWIEGGIRR